MLTKLLLPFTSTPHTTTLFPKTQRPQKVKIFSIHHFTSLSSQTKHTNIFFPRTLKLIKLEHSWQPFCILLIFLFPTFFVLNLKKVFCKTVLQYIRVLCVTKMRKSEWHKEKRIFLFIKVWNLLWIIQCKETLELDSYHFF